MRLVSDSTGAAASPAMSGIPQIFHAGAWGTLCGRRRQTAPGASPVGSAGDSFSEVRLLSEQASRRCFLGAADFKHRQPPAECQTQSCPLTTLLSRIAPCELAALRPEGTSRSAPEHAAAGKAVFGLVAHAGGTLSTRVHRCACMSTRVHRCACMSTRVHRCACMSTPVCEEPMAGGGRTALLDSTDYTHILHTHQHRSSLSYIQGVVVSRITA